MTGGCARLAGAVLGVALSLGPVGAAERSEGVDWVAAVAALEVEGLGRPEGAWTLELPRDHGPHPEAASELWTLVAHLADGDGRPVGVQLSLLRLALAPPGTGGDWLAREVYRGHAVVLDGARGVVAAEERFGRGMAGVAGFDPALAELRLDAWALRFGAGAWWLEAGAGGLRAELTMTPQRAPLAPDGADGGAPFRGYAVPRLAVEGVLASTDGRREVTGVAWFEHLWGDLPLPGGAPVASDRLVLQLDDGAELSVLRSRRVDGRGAATVEALLVGADGAAEGFGDATAEVELMRRWRGAGGTDWPVEWTVRVGALELRVAPVLDAQEHGFSAPMWSGLVRAEGRHGDRPVTGMGTLQLTGYGG